jgi:tetratricopeptide (TPR) repeat protein
LFSSTPLGDTLYNIAQYELAYVYFMQEKYDDALTIFEKLLKVEDDKLAQSMVYSLTTSTYNQKFMMKRCDPYNYNLYYNKSIVYAKVKDYGKMAIFCNPAHQSCHYQLGIAYLRQSYFVPGIKIPVNILFIY